MGARARATKTPASPNCRQFLNPQGTIELPEIGDWRQSCRPPFGNQHRRTPPSMLPLSSAQSMSSAKANASTTSKGTVRTSSRRKTLAFVITEHLRKEIVAGLRDPGSKISEPTIAAAHSVSRAPVREALRQLEREGLVVFDAVGRSRVVQLTEHDVEDICTIRTSLEAAAAEHAAVPWMK
ncbi:GntR family transcriptional regulator [bacterium]|nr:GntR family transcriptional regulator [bacterium]